MRKIINLFAFIHKNGIQAFIKELYFRLIDNYYERYFDVFTKGYISTEDLEINHHESVYYVPTHYRHIINMLNKLPVDKTNSTLVDYGCGKGRVIIAAASNRYKKIIGVELSPIINIAKSNIRKMRYRNTENIELIQCNAIDFNVPSDVNIIFFYNPFRGSILESVVKNIHSSYKANPRKLYIIYLNNYHFDEIITHQDWLTKINHSEIHLHISCGIYETNPSQ